MALEDWEGRLVCRAERDLRTPEVVAEGDSDGSKRPVTFSAMSRVLNRPHDLA